MPRCCQVSVSTWIENAVTFALLPLKTEFLKYPAIYRTQDSIKTVMPIGMIGIFLSILVLVVLYARLGPHGAGWIEGLRVGAHIGLFAMGAFALHNYVNLNIGITPTMQQAIVYFVEWTIVGVVIGLIYPAAGAFPR
jgi:hypothetical protein